MNEELKQEFNELIQKIVCWDFPISDEKRYMSLFEIDRWYINSEHYIPGIIYTVECGFREHFEDHLYRDLVSAGILSVNTPKPKAFDPTEDIISFIYTQKGWMFYKYAERVLEEIRSL